MSPSLKKASGQLLIECTFKYGDYFGNKAHAEEIRFASYLMIALLLTLIHQCERSLCQKQDRYKYACLQKFSQVNFDWLA